MKHKNKGEVRKINIGLGLGLGLGRGLGLGLGLGPCKLTKGVKMLKVIGCIAVNVLCGGAVGATLALNNVDNTGLWVVTVALFIVAVNQSFLVRAVDAVQTQKNR